MKNPLQLSEWLISNKLATKSKNTGLVVYSFQLKLDNSRH